MVESTPATEKIASGPAPLGVPAAPAWIIGALTFRATVDSVATRASAVSLRGTNVATCSVSPGVGVTGKPASDPGKIRGRRPRSSSGGSPGNGSGVPGEPGPGSGSIPDGGLDPPNLK